MSLGDFLEKLQRKPRHIKVQIMWACSVACVLLVFGAWLWSLDSLVYQNTSLGSADQDKTEELKSGLEQMKSDLPTLWQSLGAGIGSIFNSADELPEETSATQEEGERFDKLPTE